MVSDRIDRYSLGQSLGTLSQAHAVYARMGSDSPAQYYFLMVDAGQVLRAELSLPASEFADAADLRLAILGPGLPAAPRSAGARMAPDEGKLLAGRPVSPPPVVLDPLNGTQSRLVQVVQVTARAPGRYVLKVVHRGGRPVRYQLYLSGICQYQPRTVAWLPLRWFLANYSAAPAMAWVRLLLIVLVLAGAFGLWSLGMRRRITRRGGFVR